MSRIPLDELADDLKNIYQLNPAGSESMIEKYLGERLKGLSPDERLPFMEKLAQALAESKPSKASIPFQGAPDLPCPAPAKLATQGALDFPCPAPAKLATQGVLDFPCPAPAKLATQGVLDFPRPAPAKLATQGAIDFPCPTPAEAHRLLSLLMGKEAASQDLSSSELLKKLVSSVNTIYDSLNQMADTIDTILLGRRTEIEPIGQIIGSIFDKTEQSPSLKDYLDRIKDAFLITRQGFREAVQSRVGEILFELDPERIEAATSRGFKFGPIRKAELFEIYKEKYQTCQSWFEAGHLVEEVLREFERACQKIYSEKGIQKET